jgi:hypothetical protein
MAAVLLGQNKPEETKTELSETTHLSAFMVLVNKDGSFEFEPNINKPVIPERQVNAEEVKGSLQRILDDIRIQESAMLAISLIESKAKAQFDAYQNAQMAKGLKL